MFPLHRPLQGGIIGCGFFGQIRLEAWRRIPEVRIVAACDLDVEKARPAAPRAYTSPEEMMEAVEAAYQSPAERRAVRMTEIL